MRKNDIIDATTTTTATTTMDVTAMTADYGRFAVGKFELMVVAVVVVVASIVSK